jgi:hypothetical protein
MTLLKFQNKKLFISQEKKKIINRGSISQHTEKDLYTLPT